MKRSSRDVCISDHVEFQNIVWSNNVLVYYSFKNMNLTQSCPSIVSFFYQAPPMTLVLPRLAFMIFASDGRGLACIAVWVVRTSFTSLHHFTHVHPLNVGIHSQPITETIGLISYAGRESPSNGSKKSLLTRSPPLSGGVPSGLKTVLSRRMHQANTRSNTTGRYRLRIQSSLLLVPLPQWGFEPETSRTGVRCLIH